ncbi:mannosyl-oligosaccharide alpha-1,2-mannosidase [Coprinopsis cinerea okayama7|uniref:alpha-1,2-Mannosidase n=1 Tax=Coprinopsis cinerea (strain Okayama-7 / 130 / ATCC MYA-4618 / FGSC 9003) TaxID=240176 RepID=D6RNQ2_COPC7|nr:mannosyl-oligosaccharide alpha-1,2-mannosidase [Coprinopsis cinerea okayama7\|eukprot:XP_002910864.1 mannosyl-oligosaccharide alpha-1,2-mannosidase [Coprinopsis cinerea okayama7\
MAHRIPPTDRTQGVRPPIQPPHWNQSASGPTQGPKWWPGILKDGDISGTGKKPLSLWDHRANAVKDAFVYAYENYLKYAEGYDELLPRTAGKVNNFVGWGTTVHDSLDTMWIMGLHDMFRRELISVAKTRFHLTQVCKFLRTSGRSLTQATQDKYAPFFETIIRHLGGLLSAYALSGEPILLTRADDLGRMLLPAFDSPSGLPWYAVNTISGNTKAGWSPSVLWAEAMSNQMEYKYLAHLTGREEYFNRTERIMKLMHEAPLNEGLFPSMWDQHNGAPTNQQFTVGAYADSAYEYLLKQWLLTSHSEPKALELYLSSAKGIINNLLHLTPNRELLYVTDAVGTDYAPSRTLEHLSCFLPGLFALGVHTLPESQLTGEERELHLWAAEGLAETCWATYADTKTGLGPDEVAMAPWPSPPEGQTNIGSRWKDHLDKWEKAGRPGGKPPGTRVVTPESDPTKRDWLTQKDTYLLRPETVESFYVLWKATGQVRWRERGWAVFQSIEKHAKTKYGYASVVNVDQVPPDWKDEMPSYFLAETLKYLYLLFSEEDLIPFEYFVFNTEAHPFPIFEWSNWEKEEWGIGTHAAPSPQRTA